MIQFNMTQDAILQESQILLARQGIYDKSNTVYAYELLYRDCENQSRVDNRIEKSGMVATSSVIVQVFTNLDIDVVVGNKLAFINFTYTDIIQQIPALLPKDRIVIEVLETVLIDDNLVDSLNELHKKGYLIALDDFVYRKGINALIEIADIIKLDVLHQSKDAIAEQLTSLEGFKGKFLAEKIENKEQFACCIALGFDYFQGFYLNKPDNLMGQKFTENNALLLKVLAELNNADESVKNLEKSILNIPKLSYRILRVANSSYYYTGQEINSLADAILRLGVLQVIKWANLILLASNTETSLDLIERTLIRAYMCETIAKIVDKARPDEAYTVGMFSTLDGMFNEPLDSLLSKINLSKPLNQALLHHEGTLGQILTNVIAYEAGDFEALKDLPYHKKLSELYLEAIQYTNTTLGIMQD